MTSGFHVTRLEGDFTPLRQNYEMALPAPGWRQLAQIHFFHIFGFFSKIYKLHLFQFPKKIFSLHPSLLVRLLKFTLLRAVNPFFNFFVHVYLPFTRKRIVSLYFGRDARTRSGVGISEVFGPPIFHIKVGSPVRCLAQEHKKRTCRLVLPDLLNAEPSMKAGDTIF